MSTTNHAKPQWTYKYHWILDAGVDPDKISDLLIWIWGEGTSFAANKHLEGFLASLKTNYESLCSIIMTPEIWHTRAVELNSIATVHYGPFSIEWSLFAFESFNHHANEMANKHQEMWFLPYGSKYDFDLRGSTDWLLEVADVQILLCVPLLIVFISGYTISVLRTLLCTLTPSIVMMLSANWRLWRGSHQHWWSTILLKMLMD